MSESTPVQIHVLSTIRNQHDQDEETIENRTTGEYLLKGKTSYLRYEEEHELGFVKTTVKISQKEVVVMRSGAVSMKQRFIEGIQTMTDYNTPFGKLQLETMTESLSYKTTDREGTLAVLYVLQIDEQEKHVHKLLINFKEEPK